MLDHLKTFTGSENWYRHALNRQVLFTDGAKYVADEAGAYWLLDTIALSQRSEKAVAAAAFQAWKLTVHDDATAVLECSDGDMRVVYTETLDFTDFPKCGITLWCCDNVIFLPSEH